jgi:hypothetical protein
MVALVAIVVAGTVSIVHYANIGQALAGSPVAPTVTTTVAATATITARQPSVRPAVVQPDPSTSSAPADPPAPSTSLSTSASPTVSPPRLSASSKPAPTPTTTAPNPLSAPVHFRTLPPGAVLPTGAECARWVLKSKQQPEVRPGNWQANHTTGQPVGAHFFPAADKPQANAVLAPRIDGQFTGTTTEILRWAACKWGINQNVVFAQAAVESWWRQSALGDWGTVAADCPPGHKPTHKNPQCPQSYGILQNRYPYEESSWPGIGDSTAMNADTAYGIWRACYDGYEVWLNNVPHNGEYRKGDLWGCVGRWFAGRWHTPPAQGYIALVRRYLRERIWLTRRFHNDLTAGNPVSVLVPVQAR